MNNPTYKDIIEKNGFLIVNFSGISMMPLLREKRDTVKLVKITKPLKKYDVILYQRPDHKNVMHRIVKVKKNYFCLCGDNQTIIEKNVTRDMIIAVMEGFYRDETYYDINDPQYIKYYKKVVFLRPYRRFKELIKKVIKKLFK